MHVEQGGIEQVLYEVCSERDWSRFGDDEHDDDGFSLSLSLTHGMFVVARRSLKGSLGLGGRAGRWRQHDFFAVPSQSATITFRSTAIATWVPLLFFEHVVRTYFFTQLTF